MRFSKLAVEFLAVEFLQGLFGKLVTMGRRVAWALQNDDMGNLRSAAEYSQTSNKTSREHMPPERQQHCWGTLCFLNISQDDVAEYDDDDDDDVDDDDDDVDDGLTGRTPLHQGRKGRPSWKWSPCTTTKA
jgi:hypothetical protein